MNILFISDVSRKFGQNERVYFHITKENDGFKAATDDFVIKMTNLKELIRWMHDNAPNYRSNEHEFYEK